jgi:chromosome segregation ATPase
LEKVKEQLKVATEEKNKLEQRLKDEEEKSILQNQELEAEEAKNLQLTQQLQSVNAHLEHYRQVCAKVQTLEGAYLFLVRILKNRIDECLIAAELQRISRPVLSL